jgi:hypothetical protein
MAGRAAPSVLMLLSIRTLPEPVMTTVDEQPNARACVRAYCTSEVPRPRLFDHDAELGRTG